MQTRAKTTAPLAEAEKAVRVEQARLGEWRADLVAAETALEVHLAAAGERALDDPAALKSIAATTRELRDHVELCIQAIAVQAERLKPREIAFPKLAAEAAKLDVLTARDRVHAHVSRTVELLTQLKEHDGVAYVSEVKLLLATHDVNVGGTVVIPASQASLLESGVTRAERTVSILEALADGVEQPIFQLFRGETLADVYPPCVWGPTAVVPAPAYLASLVVAEEPEEQLEGDDTDPSADAVA